MKTFSNQNTLMAGGFLLPAGHSRPVAAHSVRLGLLCLPSQEWAEMRCKPGSNTLGGQTCPAGEREIKTSHYRAECWELVYLWLVMALRSVPGYK